MNPRKTTITILAMLSASFALAEDFKTVSGRVYKDATISSVEADGIVLGTKAGISKVYFVELPKDVQEKFHYGQATPIPAQSEPIKSNAKQDARRQADKGGRVVVVGQGAVSFKVVVAGILLLVVVVLAIIRSRF